MQAAGGSFGRVSGGGVQFRKVGHDGVHGSFLVGFEGGEVVAPGFVDLRGDVRVGAHGIDADKGAFEFEHGGELRQGRQLVAFFGADGMSGAEPGLMHPGAQDVDHALAGGRGGAAQGFAVDHDLEGGEIATPVRHEEEEGLGFDGHEDVAENIVAGRAVGHGQKRAQPRHLAAGELLHVGKGVVIRKHGAEGDDEDLVDGVEDVAGAADIRDGGKAEAP